MEEKERYKIHRYTLQGNEKISFNDYAEHICEHYDFGFEKIEPFNQRIQDLLNQQDKEIEELKEKYNKLYECYKEQSQKDLKTIYEYVNENQQLKEQLNYYKGTKLGDFAEEIRQLQQSQKQLAIEELTMFGAVLTRAVQWDNDSKCWTISEEVFGNFIVQIDEKIEELKGK